MKDPAFLFYSSDFLVGTLTMSFEDRGKYITLLCYQHQNGRLSEETIRLLVGSISDMLRLKFKTDENGLFYNERVEIEIKKRDRFCESRVNNGKLGGRPPKKEKPLGKPNGKPKHNLPEDVNINEIIYNKVVEKYKIEVPLGFKEIILEWLKYKSEKRQSYKETGLKNLVVSFIKETKGDLEFAKIMFEYSTSKNYDGLYAPTGASTKLSQPDELGYNESYINGIRMFNKCIPIPKGTRPCPGNMYHWNKEKQDWIFG